MVRRMPLPSISAGTDPMENAQSILTEQSFYRTRPDVSIDGKRIIYSSTAGGADQYALGRQRMDQRPNSLDVVPRESQHVAEDELAVGQFSQEEVGDPVLA